MAKGTITRWRFWYLHPQDDTPTLHPGAAHDPTVWQRETVAQCRHNPEHIPPAPDCTCGLYAMSSIDMRYFAEAAGWIDEWMARRQLWRSGKALFWAGQQGRIRDYVQAYKDAQPPIVLGSVVLHNAKIRHCQSDEHGRATRSWRARKATITGLYVPTAVADVADDLSAKYEVPCMVGYPDNVWSRAEWDARTRDYEGMPIVTRPDGTVAVAYPTYEELGLFPPK